jgi:two-component system CheB/CheR fusion protein
MAVDGLAPPLQNAIVAAKKENRPVRRKGVSVSSTNGKKGAASGEIVSFEVTPLQSALNEACLMIVFLEEAPLEPRGKAGSRAKEQKSSSSEKLKRLEEELAATREQLQSVIETQDVTNEELQSANEEILSSNEELQSTNEELETAKEELQSTNEELNTVNDELRSRNIDITGGRQDLRDLLTEVRIAVVGRDLQIRQLTPPARRLLDLLPDEVGSQIVDLHHSSDIPNLAELVERSLSGGGAPVEQVVDRAGRQYRVRVVPYGLTGDKTGGCIVTLMDASLATRLSRKSSPPLPE